MLLHPDTQTPGIQDAKNKGIVKIGLNEWPTAWPHNTKDVKLKIVKHHKQRPDSNQNVYSNVPVYPIRQGAQGSN